MNNIERVNGIRRRKKKRKRRKTLEGLGEKGKQEDLEEREKKSTV